MSASLRATCRALAFVCCLASPALGQFDEPETLVPPLPASDSPGGGFRGGSEYMAAARLAIQQEQYPLAMALLEHVLASNIDVPMAKAAVELLEQTTDHQWLVLDPISEFLNTLRKLSAKQPSPVIRSVFAAKVNTDYYQGTFGSLPSLLAPGKVAFTPQQELYLDRKFRLTRIADVAWQREVERAARGLRQPIPMHASRDGAEAVELNCQADRDSNPTTVEVIVSKNDKLTATLLPGVYLFTEEADGLQLETPLYVADFSLDVFALGSEVVLYATHPQSGMPVADVKIELFGQAPFEQQRLRTDATGMVHVRHAQGALLATAAHGGCLQAVAIWPGESGGMTRAYVSTDRPLYRPGQTVFYKVVGRQSSASGKLQLPADQTAVIEITDPAGRTLVREEKAWNDFGSISGEFVLADEPPLGGYQIAVVGEPGAPNFSPTEDDERDADFFPSSRAVAASCEFTVVAYRRPDFQVAVEGTVAEAADGLGKVQATISAKYLVGGGVTNAQVEWKIIGAQHDSNPAAYEQTEPYNDPLGWFYRDQEDTYAGGFSDGSNFFSIGGPFDGEEDDVLARGKGRTNERGELEIEFEPTANKRAARYTIEATVRDAAGAEAQGETLLDATGMHRRIELGTDRLFYSVGGTIEARLGLFHADNTPAANEAVELVVFAAAPLILHGFMGGPAEFESFYRCTVTTDAEGQASAVFKAPQARRMRILARLPEGQNQNLTSQARVDLPLVTSGPQTVNENPALTLNVLSDRRAYRTGDTMRLMLTSEATGASVLLMVVGGEQICHAQAVKMNGPCEVVEIPIVAGWPANGDILAMIRWQGEVEQTRRPISILPSESLLELSIKLPGESFRPGDAVPIEIAAFTADGTGAPAEVELAIVDEALFQMLAAANANGDLYMELPLDIRPSLLNSPVGSLGVNSSGARWNMLQGFYYPDQELGNGAWGRWPLGGGMGTMGGFGGGGGGFFGGGGFGGMGGGMGGGGWDASGGPGAVPEFRGLLSLVISQTQTVPGVGGAAAARARSNFAELWHYAAQVQTDDSGKATLKLQAPDSLTQWRVIARAITRDGRVGQAESSTLTRQDVMLRLAAPRFYTSGDEGSVATVIQNELDQEATFEVELKMAGAAGGGTKKLTVAAHGEERIEWPLRVTASVGEVRFTAAARSAAGSAAGSDALELPVPVVTYGVQRRLARSGKIDGTWSAEFELPADAAPGTALLSLHVAPAGIEAVEQALPRLAEYPYGCVEQTMSRFLPAVAAAGAMKRLEIENAKLAGDLPQMVQAGLQRLYGFQHDDGGWGWWKDDRTDDFMTAYVVLGLATAKQAGFTVDERTLANGLELLQAMPETPFALYARRMAGETFDNDLEPDQPTSDQDRAYLVLAGFHQHAARLPKSPPRGTDADDITTVSLVLRAMLAVDRGDPRVPRFTSWLMNQRRGGWWISTLDSAQAVFALTDLARGRQQTPTYEVRINGRIVAMKAGRVNLAADELAAGPIRIEVKQNDTPASKEKGELPRLYAAALLEFFGSDLSDVGREGELWFANEPTVEQVPALAVERNWERGEQDAQGKLVWKPLAAGQSARVYDRLRMVVRLAAPSGAERVMIVVPLPSGGEANPFRADVGRDESDWNGRFAQREVRDTKFCLAISSLDGEAQTAYLEFRPTRPGTYRVLPAEAFAMYEDRQQGLSRPFLLKVEDD